MDKIDRMMAEIEGRIDGKVAEADRQIRRGLGEDEPAAKPAGGIRLGALKRPALATEPELSAGFEPAPGELEQLAAYVFHSPHVQNNGHYAAVAGQVCFNPDLDDATVNAYAGIRDGQPRIWLLGGAVRVSRLLAAAASSDRLGSAARPSGHLKKVIQTMGAHLLANGAKMAGADAQGIAATCGLARMLDDAAVARRARSLAAGLDIGIIAHELGHHALGHTVGRAVNLEVSRNQEREADSFASSVISSSPFGEYLVTGTILWELVWVWCEKAGGRTAATTHPLAKERLLDFIRANAATAAALGLDENRIGEFLPG